MVLYIYGFIQVIKIIKRGHKFERELGHYVTGGMGHGMLKVGQGRGSSMIIF